MSDGSSCYAAVRLDLWDSFEATPEQEPGDFFHVRMPPDDAEEWWSISQPMADQLIALLRFIDAAARDAYVARANACFEDAFMRPHSRAFKPEPHQVCIWQAQGGLNLGSGTEAAND